MAPPRGFEMPPSFASPPLVPLAHCLSEPTPLNIMSLSSVDEVLAAAKEAGVTEPGDLVAFALGFASGNSGGGGAASAAAGAPALPKALRPAMGKDELRAAFTSVYPVVLERLQKDPIVTAQGMPAKVMEWVKRLSDYNVPHGKLNRGMIALQVAYILGADVQQAAVLGWCIEWMQAAFLVADDIMDNSQMRRGQPCWYKQEGIGLNAVNDGWILLSGVYRMLDLFCGDQPYYQRALRILRETEYRTELGQFLDLTSGEAEAEVQPALFTDETYDAIVKYKTACVAGRWWYWCWCEGGGVVSWWW
jgi:hypothetical protein